MHIKKLFLLAVTFSNIFSQQPGIITGSVRDRDTQREISEAVIKIIELNIITSSDEEGKFEFNNVPLGIYSLKISKLGYESIVKTDIVVSSSRPAIVNTEISVSVIVTGEITVEGQYFQKPQDLSTSSYNLDFEEIRRAPGAVEDISRMLQILPGVSPANDQRNDLIVRGGSPSENLILIDGIEVPNINHYPTQGSSSGPIGMINVKFIDDVNFSTGGFSARYGDRLSSVMDIRFREGYRNGFLSDINLSTAGFGGIVEGPLFTKKGSYIFSARKSYLNLIRGAIRLAAVPDYWDFNLKAVYNIDKNNKLTFLGIAGIDKISFEGEASEISDDNPYGKAKGNQEQFTAGVNIRTLLPGGYLQNIISNSTAFSDIENRDIYSDKLKFYFNSFESEYNFRSEIFHKLNSRNSLSGGIRLKYTLFKNNTYFNSDTTVFGYIIPEIDINLKDNFFKASAFLQYTMKLYDGNITLNTGIRYDYFSAINQRNSYSPRLGINFRISSAASVSFSTGIYNQSPDYLWISSDTANANLKYIRAEHYVLSFEYLLFSDLRLLVETYYKNYSRYPVSVLIPTYVLINGGTENGPNILFGPAVSEGRGFSKGIDFSIQKKFSEYGFYGMLNYSLSENKVTALEGGEKPGSFDYRHNLTISAGYQFGKDWLIGFKFRYTTGRPYTPFDIEKSILSGRGVSDFSDFNGARYKDYNRFDLRVDKKWNFRKLTIVSYIEFQNLFNTENVYEYFWNEYKNEQGTIYQWKFLPVFGLSIQF